VRRGESFASIAPKYGLSAQRLAEMNSLSVNAQLRAGRRLALPEQLPRVIGAPGAPASASAVVAAVPASPENATASSAPSEDYYVVRRGDSLQLIAARVRVPEAQLLRINALKIRIACTKASGCESPASRRQSWWWRPRRRRRRPRRPPSMRPVGKAQREGAVVEVLREETTRPIGIGEPYAWPISVRGHRRHGGRHHAGSRELGGQGR
jgi:LysM repeat protein